MRFIGIIGILLFSFTCYSQSDSTIKWHCDSVDFMNKKMITNVDVVLQSDRVLLWIGNKPSSYYYTASHRFDNKYVISLLTNDSETWQFQMFTGIIKYESMKFYKCLILNSIK